MNLDLVKNFNDACDMAKVISELPNLTESQYGRIFEHVSNGDMVTTIRTIQHAYSMIQKEQVISNVNEEEEAKKAAEAIA